jgi:hypothetical protein
MPRTAHSFAEFLANDPVRSPRWRFERIQRLLSRQQQPERSRDDKWVIEACRFLRRWEQLGRDRNGRVIQNQQDALYARQSLYTQNPGLFAAYAMVLANPDRQILEIEARILARETDQAIAGEVSTAPATIDWYEKLFFNVRDRLTNRGYIVNRIISTEIAASWDDLGLEISSKFFGYFAGPAVLNVILHHYDSSLARPGHGDSPNDFFDAHLHVNLRRRLAEAVNVFELNKYNIVELMGVHTQITGYVMQAKKEKTDISAMEKTVASMMSSIQFHAGPDVQTSLEQNRTRSYYSGAAELRADEMLALSQGKFDTVDPRELTLTIPKGNHDAIADERRRSKDPNGD